MPLVEVGIACSIALVGGASAMSWRRAKVYRAMRARQEAIISRSASVMSPTRRQSAAVPAFTERIAFVDGVLDDSALAALRVECERLSTERSFIPTHKKGGTVAFETLCRAAPEAVAVYLSTELREMVSRIVGEKVVPTPNHDQSSCSLLFYERPGDHIGWHYDHNFYKGRHFTVLLPIVNRDARGEGLSAARLMARIGDEERVIDTPPNRLVVFEGAHVLHKATPIGEGERRILLSMTFATDPRSTIAQGTARRLKDTAFFGIRALWT